MDLFTSIKNLYFSRPTCKSLKRQRQLNCKTLCSRFECHRSPKMTLTTVISLSFRHNRSSVSGGLSQCLIISLMKHGFNVIINQGILRTLYFIHILLFSCHKCLFIYLFVCLLYNAPLYNSYGDVTINSSSDTAVARWVRAFTPQAEGWMFESQSRQT